MTAYILIAYDDGRFGVCLMGEVNPVGWPAPDRCAVVGTAEDCGRWLAAHLGIVL